MRNAGAPVALAVNFGVIYKMTNDHSPAEWWAFNNGFVNTQVRSADELSSNVASKGHSICACHKHVHIPYVNAKGEDRIHAYRYFANWEPTSAVVLDFDDGTYDHRSIFVDPFVSRYAYLTYTTTSHTPEHPRFRLVFATPRPIVKIENYRSLLAALCHRFSVVDKASKDVVKAYAGNAGGNYDKVVHDRMLPIEVAAGEVRAHQALLEEERRLRLRRAEQYLDGSQEEFDADEIANLLRYIPPSGDYIEWFKVIAATTRATGNPEASVVLCESWSPGYQGEVEAKVKSVHGEGAGLAYLIKRAKQYGYETPSEREQRRLHIVRQSLRRLS